jgi:outer membrane receptor for ferrienterochelin and colicins
MKWSLKVAAIFLWVAWARPLSAQSPCNIALIEAQKAYDIGRFEEVLDHLDVCVQGAETTRNEEVEALRLVAMAWIGADDSRRAAEAVQELLALKPNFETTLRDPPRFARLVEEVRLASADQQVTSVSKNSESILLAPATVQLITEEEIRRRGYADLEALLHDLPGFDISRGNGVFYSNIYQRGYRSNGTDRTLFLFDGVEENDLWSNFANISRQYPLSNIKRVEVVYGPASTMYGPNAYSGVINIITKDPEDLVERGQPLGIRVQVGTGSYATRYADMTLAAQREGLAFSLTGRVYRSDEADLSSYDAWDFATHAPDFYQDKLAIRDVSLAANFLGEFPEAVDHPYLRVERDAEGGAVAIEVTESGAAAAVSYDSTALRQRVNGAPIGFSNETNDWLVYGKLRLGDLLLGLQSWRRQEGSIGWFPDDREASTQNGGEWIPRHSFFYARYEKSITEALSVSSFTRYKVHSLDEDNRIVIFRSYAGEGRLDLGDLVRDNAARWSTLYFNRLSRELRSELKSVYAPTARFTLVSGVEFRRSQIQGEYTVSTVPHPAETGFAFAALNDYDQRDIGAYTQATYRPAADLKLVLGGRYDDNKVRDTLGYGTVFNPRAAVVWHPGALVFKAIYAEAFKAASNSAKFSTSPSRSLTSPDLEPEKVRNLDLGASWQVDEKLLLDAVFYQAEYSDVIGAVEVVLEDGSSTTQNRAIGALQIRGLTLGGAYRGERLSLRANYNYTDPQNIEARDASGQIELDAEGQPVERRIGDIATHRLNMGGNIALTRRLGFDMRLNAVGARRTGAGTTVPDNPHREVDAYAVLGSSLTWRGLAPGLELQVVADNLLDTEYFHPGVRSAEDAIHVALLPQNGRVIHVRLRCDF